MILESLIIGIAIAAIPGPIFFEVVRRTLLKGFWYGALLSIGEFLGNFFLLALIFFGISNLLTSNISKIIFYFAGSFVLCWLGVQAFKLKEENVKKSYIKKIKSSNSIAVGFGIAVTSPIVIALWISLSGSYLAQFSSKLLSFLNIFIISIGFVIFHFTLAFITYKIRHYIPPKKVILLSRIFGVVLFVYSVSLFYEFIKLITNL